MGTMGEFIKTKAAQAEADSLIRKYTNELIRDGYKLVKSKKGKRGTLDYGKIVLMFTKESGLKSIRPNAKPWYIVHKWDYGILARYVSHTSKNIESKLYKQKSSAEKQYQIWVKWL